MNPHASTNPGCCPVIELRQYTLKPGQREVLIELFDRYFVEGQESTGMTVIGQFRDRREPDRFVWLRGFPDMARRHQSLEAFYGGPIWATHREAANRTMAEWDDVLLLKPARLDTAFAMESSPTAAPSCSRVLVGMYRTPQPVDHTLVSEFERQIVPFLHSNGIKIAGIFVTESAANTFVRLPVREGQNVLVWFGLVERPEAVLDPEQLTTPGALRGLTMSILDLEPTPRSTLGNGPLAARGTARDFDFLFGSWKVQNRFLTRRLQRSTAWMEFDAQLDVQSVLNGLGNVDRYRAIRDGKSIEGVTLRLFDPATGQWSIYWADTERPGALLPPMIGRFNGDLGTFFGAETVDGRNVECRFLWTRSNINAPRWEQAFSDDHGVTWETNWIMDFSREV